MRKCNIVVDVRCGMTWNFMMATYGEVTNVWHMQGITHAFFSSHFVVPHGCRGRVQGQKRTGQQTTAHLIVHFTSADNTDMASVHANPIIASLNKRTSANTFYTRLLPGLSIL